MTQGAKAMAGSSVSNIKTMYAISVGINLVIAIGHIGYAFSEYHKLDESALWFFSGALAIIFNAGINGLCLRKYDKTTYVIAMIANSALLVFSVALAIVATEVQTVSFAAAVLYTVIVCFNYQKRICSRL